MGSRIGDYIHYHTINYLTYGTNRVEKSISPQAAIAEQKENLRRHIAASQKLGLNGNDTARLTRILNTFMRPLQDPSQYLDGESPEEYEEIWNILLEFFTSEFGIAKDVVYKDTLNIIGNPLVTGIKRIKPEKGAKNVLPSTLQGRIDLIYNALMAGKANENLYTKEQLQQIEKAYADVIAEKEKMERKGITQLQRLSLTGSKRINKKIPLEDAKGLIKAINNAARLSSATANLQKGTLFEYLIAVAPLIGKGLTGQALRDSVLSALGRSGPYSGGTISLSQAMGSSKTSVQFDKNSFLNLSDSQWKQIFTTNNYHLNDNLYIANSPSFDKVDVTLTFSPGKPPVQISAKNVNLTGRFASNIHLVSNMSFLSALNNIESHEFVNHYLNQHVFRVPYSLVNMYAASATVLNLSLLEQAWRGYKANAAQADIFVINNNMTGQVQIINIGDILDKIYNSGNIGQVCKIDPNVSGLTIPMQWSQTGAYDRITKILAAIHSIKVSVSLYPELFGGGAH